MPCLRPVQAVRVPAGAPVSRSIWFRGRLNRRGRKAARMVLRSLQGRGGLCPFQFSSLATGYLVCSRPGARPLMPRPELLLTHPAVPDDSGLLPTGEKFDRWVASILTLPRFVEMVR